MATTRATARRLLMVRPTYYRIAYEINPWMSRSRPASTGRAVAQWEALHRLLREEMGACVCLAPAQVDCPDMAFSANAGLVFGRKVVLSNFRHPERQPEAPHFRRWFEAQGYETVELPPERYFEGEGDALFVGDTLFAGYRWRSDVRAHHLLATILGVRVLSLELTDPRFYHLDTCFCPLDDQTVAFYPGAFDDYACQVIRAHVPGLIEVEEAEAARFACNAVVLDRTVALNAGCPLLEGRLRELGFTTHATPLDEFLKAGGSAKCLTLHLERELTPSPGRPALALDARGPAAAAP